MQPQVVGSISINSGGPCPSAIDEHALPWWEILPFFPTRQETLRYIAPGTWIADKVSTSMVCIASTNLLLPTLEGTRSVVLLALVRMGTAYFCAHATSTWCVFGIEPDTGFRCKHILRVLGSLDGT